MAVTFDLGQTLVDLDHALLARRVAERGAEVDPQRTAVHSQEAWHAYDTAKGQGHDGRAAWTAFVRTLLLRAGVRPRRASPASSGERLAHELTDWLWTEQPVQNLWCRPIEGMFELVHDLVAAGVPVGAVSNSEGRLAELVEQLGEADCFGVIADSGRLGFEKPDRRIFDYAAARLGVPIRCLVHVGDSWEADVKGALGAGARAIWFARGVTRSLPDGVAAASNATEVRAALQAFGEIPKA